ncbi:MAG: hypothetical protein RQ736_07410 [Thiogranum sp.]|nr:hypothetical protein [Thiogranum sp.]
MLRRASIIPTLLICSAFALFTAGTSHAAPNQIRGEVTEVIEAAGYTYAEVDTGEEKVWAAAATTPVEVGDTIAFTTEMPMRNFHSSSMNRDFPLIYFVKSFTTGEPGAQGATTGMALPHAGSKAAPASGSVADVDKVEGGNTIAEVYADGQKLAGKTLRVRGQVTKFTPNVMGTNWIHIEDGSSESDLTVTTDSKVSVGAVVVIEGPLTLDKDFGHGYVYPAIVEGASVIVE